MIHAVSKLLSDRFDNKYHYYQSKRSGSCVICFKGSIIYDTAEQGLVCYLPQKLALNHAVIIITLKCTAQQTDCY